MKVTIITVVYNAVDKIESTLKSVFQQNYPELEYIVVDGGSVDGTREIIEQYNSRISRLVSEPDNGIYDALNKGIGLATGEWIGILNAGDVFSSNSVLNTVFFKGMNYDDVDVLYGDAISVDGNRREICRADGDLRLLEKHPTYRHGASFVKTSTHQRFMFNLALMSKLEFALDYEQIYRMYKSGCVFRRIDLTIINYECRGVSTISPFKPRYYNYLITHNMECNLITRLGLMLWDCFRKVVSGMVH